MNMDFISSNIAYLVSDQNTGKDAFGKLFGLNRGAISSYIDGKSKPKIETLQKISEKFNISLDNLVKQDLSKIKLENLTNDDKNICYEALNIVELLKFLLNKNDELMSNDGFKKYIEMNAKKLNLEEIIKENDSELDKLKNKYLNKIKKQSD